MESEVRESFGYRIGLTLQPMICAYDTGGAMQWIKWSGDEFIFIATKHSIRTSDPIHVSISNPIFFSNNFIFDNGFWFES